MNNTVLDIVCPEVPEHDLVQVQGVAEARGLQVLGPSLPQGLVNADSFIVLVRDEVVQDVWRDGGALVEVLQSEAVVEDVLKRGPGFPVRAPSRMEAAAEAVELAQRDGWEADLAGVDLEMKQCFPFFLQPKKQGKHWSCFSH